MIEFTKVSFSYGTEESRGLEDVSLFVRKGEFILICGASGCGKTTMTRLINGLIPNFFQGRLSGTVKVSELDTTKTTMAELSDVVGTVFQNPRTQFFNADTDSEIVFGMENQAVPVPDILERLSVITDELNLEGLRKRSIFELSGGEKQKIAFASSYAPSPEVLILDEPSSNLDHTSIEELTVLLKKAKESNMTILVSEHRLWYLMELVDRVVLMEKGKIKRIFSSEEFKNLSKEEYQQTGLRSRSFISDRLREQRRPVTSDRKVLYVQELSAKVGNKKVLDCLNFEIQSGEVVAITGKNGAGKTTLARVLCGLGKSSGLVQLNRRILKNRDRTELSYMVMQDVGHQLFGDSVENECRLGIGKISSEKIDSSLAAMDLLEYKDRHPLSLSGGQKQRLAVVISMICDKEILIFDEPTSGLDLRGVYRVAAMFEDLSELGKFVLVITHDYELIERACSRALHLKDGRIALDCTRKDFDKIYGAANHIKRM